MKIYQFHPITKEFLWEKDAREDPLDKGKYLVPGSATTIPPIEVSEGMVAVFDGKKWNEVIDNRGLYFKKQVFFDPTSVEVLIVEMPGELSPEGYTKEIPPAFKEADNIFVYYDNGWKTETRVWYDKVSGMAETLRDFPVNKDFYIDVPPPDDLSEKGLHYQWDDKAGWMVESVKPKPVIESIPDPYEKRFKALENAIRELREAKK